MGKLTYVNNMSLDGYIEDRDGAFDLGPWTTTCSRPTPTWSARSGRSSTGAACTRRWRSGRPTPLWQRSRR